ncbi:MAG: four helix bundle protein [Planctomycetota bacterium]
MEAARCFEDLWVWQEARVVVRNIYSDFGAGTPACQDFGFRNQVQKAGISVMNNIAEGFERNSDADFARFLEIAKGSCGEVRSMYYPAQDLQYVTEDTAAQRRETLRRIAAGIASLIAHLRKPSD